MSAANQIRKDIRNLLTQNGYWAINENIEFIFAKHLGDSTDMPLSRLIDLHGHLLTSRPEKREVKYDPTDADKALAILKAFHNIAYICEKHEPITITRCGNPNTLTIGCISSEGWQMKNEHFGQPGSEGEEGFSILINQLYERFCPNQNKNN